MNSHSDHSITPAELVQAFLRHKWKVVTWCGLVAVLSVATLFAWPRKYESEAKLYLRLGRESVALDPTAATGAMVQVQEPRENQLNSARDMLKSRALLERVVTKLGAETILKGPPAESRTGLSATMAPVINFVSDTVSTVTAYFSLADVSAEEKAVEKLSKSMSVTLAKNSCVINVACKAKNPALAQEILQTFLEAYREQHMSANHTDGSFDFFDEQSTQIKQELDTAIAELRDAKNDLGLISISIEQQAVERQLAQIDESLMATQSALAATEASSGVLRKSLEQIPKNHMTEETKGFANVAADAMQQEYFKLLISITELQAKLGENHPLIKITREQAEKLQGILDKQAADRTQTTMGLNSSHLALDLDYRREEALAASLRAKAGTLTEQKIALQERMRTLNENEVRISDLERRVTITETKYLSHVEHFEQARITDELEANRISNVNMVQAPTLVHKPVNPKPLFLVGMALVAMLTGSLALVAGSEYLDRLHSGSEGRSARVQRSENDTRFGVAELQPVAVSRST